MMEGFRQKKHPAILLAGCPAPGEQTMDHLLQSRQVEVQTIPSMSRRISPLADLRALLDIIRIFRRTRPMVVHTHTAKAGVLGRLAAIVTGVPVRVHTFHGNIFDGYFPGWLARIFLAIERLLARRTDCIIALCESQKKQLAEVYRVAPAAKIQVIPLGFDLDGYVAVQQATGTFACDAHGPVVGWVGRLTAIKAPERFLAASERVLQVFPAARFAMIGDGELRQSCQQQMQQSGIADRVSLLGWQSDMPSVYAGLDVVVLTSKNEGTPLALLEAMASAKPIVSTDVGGVRDLMVGCPQPRGEIEVFANGILVRNAASIASAICYLLSDRQRGERMGRAGREFVARRFSHHRLISDLEALYLALAESKGALGDTELVLNKQKGSEPAPRRAAPAVPQTIQNQIGTADLVSGFHPQARAESRAWSADNRVSDI